MNGHGGGMLGGFGGISRQVETFRSDDNTEMYRPNKQAWKLVLAIWIALSVFFIDLILTGPWIGYVVIEVLIIIVWLRVNNVFGWKYARWLLTAPGIWLLRGMWMTEKYWFPVRPDLPPWLWLVCISFSAAIYLACYLFGYRMAYETVDDKWSPPIMPRRPESGPAWPRVSFGLPEVKIREVPRPFVVHSQAELPEPNGQVLDAVPLHDTIMSPTGVELRTGDVLQYMGAAQKIGADSRTWKKIGWNWKYWNGVVRLLAQLLILDMGNKSKPRFLVTDVEEMKRRLEQFATKENG